MSIIEEIVSYYIPKGVPEMVLAEPNRNIRRLLKLSGTDVQVKCSCFPKRVLGHASSETSAREEIWQPHNKRAHGGQSVNETLKSRGDLQGTR